MQLFSFTIFDNIFTVMNKIGKKKKEYFSTFIAILLKYITEEYLIVYKIA